MSAPEPPPELVPLKEFDSGSIVLILAGVILLLPGACALFFAVTMIPGVLGDSAFFPLVLLWAVCLAISYGGIRLIRRGSRR